jgi:hypothetical protein
MLSETPLETSFLKTLDVCFGKITSRHYSLFGSFVRLSDIIAPFSQRKVLIVS